MEEIDNFARVGGTLDGRGGEGGGGVGRGGTESGRIEELTDLGCGGDGFVLGRDSFVDGVLVWRYEDGDGTCRC